MPLIKKFSEKYLNENIQIKQIIQTSLIDWDNRIVTTLYTGRCNFRCPFCYNVKLVLSPDQIDTIPEKIFLEILLERKKFIDGVCLSGGEPTMNRDLPGFLSRIKEHHLLVKLDTNGSYPEMLKRIIEQNLVDYIAMDIKNSLSIGKYQMTTGIVDENLVDKIKESIHIIMQSEKPYEFRTTVIPELHNASTIENIAKSIYGAQKYVIQNFNQTENMIEPAFKEKSPYKQWDLQEMEERAKPFVQECLIR